MNEQNMSEKKVSDPAKPPVHEVFAVGLLGLPLKFNDNFVCGLVIVLAAMLQIRFNNTFLGEGWLALFGFVGFVAMRLWLLSRRYPAPGEIIIETAGIFFPASVNSGQKQVVDFADCKRVTVWFFKTKGGGRNLTSIEFTTDRQSYRINWLMTDLNLLERSLGRRGVQVIHQAGSYERVVGTGMLVFIMLLVLFIVQALLR